METKICSSCNIEKPDCNWNYRKGLTGAEQRNPAMKDICAECYWIAYYRRTKVAKMVIKQVCTGCNVEKESKDWFFSSGTYEETTEDGAEDALRVLQESHAREEKAEMFSV